MNQARRKFFGGCACCAPSATIGRRQFVAGGMAALGIGAFTAAGIGPKAAAQGKPQRIDVHHHILAAALARRGEEAKLDNPPIVNWSPQKSLDDMDKAGIATAVVSPTTPQVNFSRRHAPPRPHRARVERIHQEADGHHPGRFGMFAMLPLPHVDESLQGDRLLLRHAQGRRRRRDDELRRQVAGLSAFAPVWEELNRRKATVYTHPTTPNCCRQSGAGRGESTIEFGTDTTRTIASLLLQRHLAALQGHQFDLLARRRRAHRVCRAFPGPGGEHTALQGQVHARNRRRRAQALLLRHRPDLERGDDRRARQAGADLADRLRHRLSLSHRGSTT